MNNFAKSLAATVLGAALVSGVNADEMSMDLDTQAAELAQAIQLAPELSEGNSTIEVNAVDGRLVMTGFVSGLEQKQQIDDVIENTEGIDMDLVDDRTVMQ